MKITKYIILLLAVVSASCTKIVDIDLNDAEPQIVVDAAVFDIGFDTTYAQVKLSWTGSFYQNNTFNPIENAKIKVTDDKGFVFNFTSVSPGIYSSTDKGIVNYGGEYFLEIETEGKNLESTSTMPTRVEIDSIGFEIFEFGPHEQFIYPLCYFTDPAGEDNYYYLKINVDNKGYYTDYFITTDNAQDGQSLNYFFFQAPLTLENSQVMIELYTIDEATYEYFKVLDQTGGGGMSAAPGNPISNIDGGAIGIFRATSVSRRTRSIPI